jgi:DNA-binding NarL/FixJ family response regulator
VDAGAERTRRAIETQNTLSIKRVIVLTSKDDRTIRARATSAGVSAFFMKGMAAEQLLAAISSALSNPD